jgi:hypothetical protein
MLGLDKIYIIILPSNSFCSLVVLTFFVFGKDDLIPLPSHFTHVQVFSYWNTGKIICWSHYANLLLLFFSFPVAWHDNWQLYIGENILLPKSRCTTSQWGEFVCE